jgi:hypothetical protein
MAPRRRLTVEQISKAVKCYGVALGNPTTE